ncbi:MAG: hypothetical protein JW931_07330 [Methanomicrobiaceae archaeon]|nr:hypothetical protein [Methanomicrobiaceae archaeon]
MRKTIVVLMLFFLLFSGCTYSEQVDETGISGKNDTTTEIPVEFCDQKYLNYKEQIPSDTSVPVEENLPGLKYSFGINDTGRTVTMNQGDAFEITLLYPPSLPFRWILIAEPEGLLLLNVGEFSDASPEAEDYRIQVTKGPWNHRWRYLAEEEGTYFFDGILAIDPCDKMGPCNEFNMTVVVA